MYADKKTYTRGFTLIEVIVVTAVIAMLSAVVVALLSDAQRDVKDKRRIVDLQQLEKALSLYYVDYQTFPKESEGANGNISTNTTFQNLMAPYVQGIFTDPNKKSSEFYYYYDGAHQCGNRVVAVVFARQMDKVSNANYDEFFTTTCSGILDGEEEGEESNRTILSLGQAVDRKI